MKTWWTILGTLGLAATCWAVTTYDLREITPTVQEALNNRKARFVELAQQKAAGTIGEDNQGHIAQLESGSEVSALVAAENADREVIYQAIVEQNGLPREALTTVRTVFGQTQRDRAGPGERVQLPSGEWTTK